MKRLLFLNRSYEALLGLLGEFKADFMFGLTTGVYAISIIFYRFQGWPRGVLFSFDVALSPYGQFHLVSVDLFFTLIPLSYYFLRLEENNGKRVFASLLFPIMVFSLHDISWLIETHFVPQVYLNGMVMNGIHLEEYIFHYSKNLINIIPSFAIFLKYRYFKINKRFLALFVGMVAFHLFDIIFQINVYILSGLALMVMELVDTIPFLFLILVEERKRETPDTASEVEKLVVPGVPF